MIIEKTAIKEVFVIKPKVYTDDRGFFMETFRADFLESQGLNYNFVQDNHSGSIKNVLRGVHYQIVRPQGKLIRVIKGEVFDVAVDLRRSSPTFAKWVGIILSSENHNMLWIPPGFGHGFYVISDWAEIIYKTTEYYSPDLDRTIVWNDPDLGISWPIQENMNPILSEKDKNGKLLKEADLYE